MSPTSATAPTAPATIAPVLSGAFVGAVIVVFEDELAGAPGTPAGTTDGIAGAAAGVASGNDGTGDADGAGNDGSDGSDGIAEGAPPQLVCPVGAHHEGRGLHPAGAVGTRRRRAVAVPLPYLPSTLTPSAACAAQTIAALLDAHGSADTSACTAAGSDAIAGVDTGRGNADGSDGRDGRDGIAAGDEAAAPLQLLFPVGAHHEGRGLQPAGALGMSFRSAVAVPLPYFPSAVTPSARCAAQTICTLSERQGSIDAITCAGPGTDTGETVGMAAGIDGIDGEGGGGGAGSATTGTPPPPSAAVQDFGPTMPSAASPCALCQLLVLACVLGPNKPSAVTPMMLCHSATSASATCGPGFVILICLCGALGAAGAIAPSHPPTMPPTGTLIVSPWRNDCQVRCPATVVMGLCELARTSELIVTPYRRAIFAGLSPALTE